MTFGCMLALAFDFVHVIKISNTRDMTACSILFPNTDKRVENTTLAAEYFGRNSRCLEIDETLSQVFDISSHGYDFLCFNLMNY